MRWTLGIRKKKQKKVDTEGGDILEIGDAWIYTTVKRGSYFFVAFSVGKWTQSTCREMIDKTTDRIVNPSPEHKLQIFTDGNDDYTYILPEYFSADTLEYGQLVKIRERGTVIRKERRTIFGNPDSLEINTTDVENFNGILRERVGRLVRETKCFSKKKVKLVGALNFFQFYWNFMNEFDRGKSPAMLEDIDNHVWSWDDFLWYHYAV